jgi:pimeloyl-ACP methyl ester carboxylesterase
MTAEPTVRTRQVLWCWQGQDITLGVDEAGDGPPVLLLPALSSISTRHEMRPLIQGLASNWHLIAIDWPGFGDQPRPPIAWTPDALSAFLEWFVRGQVPALHATVAAGHAASYALHLAAQHPGVLGRLALLAPTWRGPLPTMAGGDRPIFGRIRRAVAMPVVGPAIYRLNVNPLVVRMMVAGHVYSDRRQLSAERMREKQQVIAARGARFGSAAFVTGGLDRVRSREQFLDLAKRAGGPILVAYGAETPPKSRAEMEALAALPGVRSFVAPRGKLGFYEEHAASICDVTQEFLIGQSASNGLI